MSNDYYRIVEAVSPYELTVDYIVQKYTWRDGEGRWLTEEVFRNEYMKAVGYIAHKLNVNGTTLKAYAPLAYFSVNDGPNSIVA